MFTKWKMIINFQQHVPRHILIKISQKTSHGAIIAKHFYLIVTFPEKCTQKYFAGNVSLSNNWEIYIFF